MRSTTTTSRRRRSPRPSRPQLLEATARLIDQGTVDEPGHVVVHGIEEPTDLVLGFLALPDGTHPFDELAGCVAAPEWSLVALRVRGTAHHLDRARPSERTAVTFVVHRSGDERAVLRTGGAVTSLPGPASGTLPDLCRRMLGLPTQPPPAPTALLFALAWLDRLMEHTAPLAEHRRRLTWADVARLHPAVGPLGDGRATAGVAELVAAARHHAAAWPWARLRAEPQALPLPDGDLPTHVTRWMDDGFYARWALAAYPAPTTLAHDLSELLGPELGARLLEALEAILR